MHDKVKGKSQWLLLKGWGLPLILSAALFWLNSFGFLLFHTVAELFSIFVAFMMGVVAWHTFRFSENHYLMYLGCGYVAVGLLDFAHTFSYEGIGILETASINTSASIWVAGRYMEAALLLSAPLFLTRALNRGLALAGYLIVAIVMYWAVVNGLFPVAFEPSGGLTPFKIYSEYIIMALLAGAIMYLWMCRNLVQASMRWMVLLSIVLTIVAEFLFTQYASIVDSANIYGHILKFLSYWLIFAAIIQTTLKEPFQVLARGAHTYDAIPDPVLVVDHQGLIREVNQAATRFTGREEHQLLGSHCHEWFHNPERTHAECEICQAIGRGSVDTRMAERASEQSWLETSLSPIRTRAGLEGMVHTVRDITERKRAQDALAAYRDELEQQVHDRTVALEAINEELEGFNYSVSHDLRTPLRAIDGFSLMLVEEFGNGLNDTGRDCLRRIRNATQRMGHLIDDLLQLSRVSRGELQCEDTDVAAMSREAVTMLQDSEPERDVQIDIPSELSAYGDRGLLRVVIDNLIGNAWKYTRNTPNARIAIDGWNKDGMFVYRVSDNGAGFDMAYADKLFGAFQRLHREEEYEGTGIGLATVRRIINRHGGNVWAESEPGQGSHFYFSLPARKSAPC